MRHQSQFNINMTFTFCYLNDGQMKASESWPFRTNHLLD